MPADQPAPRRAQRGVAGCRRHISVPHATGTLAPAAITSSLLHQPRDGSACREGWQDSTTWQQSAVPGDPKAGRGWANENPGRGRELHFQHLSPKVGGERPMRCKKGHKSVEELTMSKSLNMKTDPCVGPRPGLSGSWSPAHPGHPLSQALRSSRANEGRQESLASETQSSQRLLINRRIKCTFIPCFAFF